SVFAIGFSFLHFSAPGHFLEIRPEDWQRIVIVTFGTVAISILVGLLKSRTMEAMERERRTRLGVEATNRRLGTLPTALDQVDYGVVLLDHELRAQFSNKAFRALWMLPDALAESAPPFVALMFHGRDTRAYSVPDATLDAYVAERVRLVRTGDPDPIDIRLSSGETVRFKCTGLPDGGRMLSYTQVTDLIRPADH